MTSPLLDGFRARYGASPLHLLLVLCSFALTAYAGIRLLEDDALMVAVWFVGAALVHDLLLLPLYTVTDRALQALLLRVPGAGARGAGTMRKRVNYVRVPAFISLLLLAVWWPLVLNQVDRYAAYTGLNAAIYWGNWLLITAVLFALSALCLVVSALRGRRPGGGNEQ
ncbi:hypothetical protein [Streptomyces albidus (ex Kaewkla and Franco 2022)]|uniref:hypothetical protein n=1 Tax=Streptomyces albidus (ex Kaewkla and Franco 2022) TaxID=722709 RepID=UPI0028157A36|nr:hypothetical protein [Streptomyces albidus (ex Kaewkla and Franco 2022)]